MPGAWLVCIWDRGQPHMLAAAYLFRQSWNPPRTALQQFTNWVDLHSTEWNSNDVGACAQTRFDSRAVKPPVRLQQASV
jgi:hypothetical protein